MEKKEIRKKYVKLRAELSEFEKNEKSIQIAQQIEKLPIWNLNNFHIFLPIIKKNEVNTNYIIDLLKKNHKKIIFPKVENQQLSHFLFSEKTIFKENSWGILEPENGEKIEEKNIDVVFVPLLAFDNQGNRVGYGGGFYDKFLAQCRADTLKIGLSFFAEFEIISDTLATDIPLDYCVTPSKSITF